MEICSADDDWAPSSSAAETDGALGSVEETEDSYEEYPEVDWVDDVYEAYADDHSALRVPAKASLREKADRATSELVLDPRTRLILFKSTWY